MRDGLEDIAENLPRDVLIWIVINVLRYIRMTFTDPSQNPPWDAGSNLSDLPIQYDWHAMGNPTRITFGKNMFHVTLAIQAVSSRFNS